MAMHTALKACDGTVARFGEHGIDAAMATVAYGGTAEAALVTALTERQCDVVVVGGGIRRTEQLLPLFEQIVNLIRRHAPRAAIAFNAGVGDILEAARRRL
ncbi:hypothetical protein AB0D29_21075 [Streptomyces sp. NPDC048424]|uniref:hypothetical protein n=1 Tax=Streptomyces sp. NPDC048424 TaxID=3155265 RepID=UPI0034370FD6